MINSTQMIENFLYFMTLHTELKNLETMSAPSNLLYYTQRLYLNIICIINYVIYEAVSPMIGSHVLTFTTCTLYRGNCFGLQCQCSYSGNSDPLPLLLQSMGKCCWFSPWKCMLLVCDIYDCVLLWHAHHPSQGPCLVCDLQCSLTYHK